jgi:hypothetical protein
MNTLGKPGSVSNSYSIYYAYDIHRTIQIRNTNNGNIDPQVYIGNGLHAAKMYKLFINQPIHDEDHRFLTQ